MSDEDDVSLKAGEEVLAEDLNAVEDAEDTPDTGDESSDAEARARRMGWAPKEEWRGDEARWKTADEFLSFMDGAPAVQRERLEKADKKLAEFEGTAEDLKRQLALVTKRLKEQDQRGYDRALAEVKKTKRFAAESGDMEAFEAAEAEEDKLRESASKGEQEEAQVDNGNRNEPEGVKTWKAKNTWFDRNMEMTRAAEGLSRGFNEMNPGAGGDAMLEYVEKKIRLQFPEKFENPNRREAPKTAASGLAVKSGSKKTYADLPADAKKACAEFVHDGIYKTRDEYVEDYFKQEA